MNINVIWYDTKRNVTNRLIYESCHELMAALFFLLSLGHKQEADKRISLQMKKKDVMWVIIPVYDEFYFNIEKK